MQYKVKDIPDEGLEVALPLPTGLATEALSPSGADLEASPLEVDLQLFRQGNEVLVRGRLHGEVTLPCSFCLQPMKVEIDTPVELLFAPTGETPEIEEDDPLNELDVLPYDGHVVDVAEPLRELVIVSLPMAPRCKDTCKGLCPVCGQNRNEIDCGHESSKPARKSALASQLEGLGLAPDGKQKN